MQALSHSQLKTLIQLESEGKITPKEIYKRCALAKVQAEDNYVSTAIVHAVVGVALVGLAGQLIIPIVAASWAYTWFKAYSSRQNSISEINSGNIADYLDGEDRISFEKDMKALETVEVAAVPTVPSAQALPVAQALADFHQASPVSQPEPDSIATSNPVAQGDSGIVDLSEASPLPNIAEDLGKHPYPL